MISEPVIGGTYRYFNRQWGNLRSGQTCRIISLGEKVLDFLNVLVEFDDGYKTITDTLHLLKNRNIQYS